MKGGCIHSELRVFFIVDVRCKKVEMKIDFEVEVDRQSLITVIHPVTFFIAECSSYRWRRSGCS